MNFDKFFKMENCKVPEDIAVKLVSGGDITYTDFEEKNQILPNCELHKQTGYIQNKNGDWLVSMYCPMPGVTKEMVDWWFWWHPQDSDRYRAWYPGEHFAVGYAKKDKEYFQKKQMPAFQSNVQYPVEKIGKLALPLSIEFVSPEEFGFSEKAMKENEVATVVCGHVGALKGIVQHTEMAHIFFHTDQGLFMVSRFWLGKRLKNKLLRKVILNKETASSMAEHCCVEYRNFAQRIPMLYSEYKKGR